MLLTPPLFVSGFGVLRICIGWGVRLANFLMEAAAELPPLLVFLTAMRLTFFLATLPLAGFGEPAATTLAVGSLFLAETATPPAAAVELGWVASFARLALGGVAVSLARSSSVRTWT